MDIKFGRLIPPDMGHIDKYPIRNLGFEVPKTIEFSFDLPNLFEQYDQGNLGACIGYSASWMQSIYNRPPVQLYDAVWLYHRAQLTDGDPDTSPEADNGTTVRAAFNVLRREGHRQIANGASLPADKKDGITSYYWCRSVDDIRSAFSKKRVVVFGIDWYSSFMNPTVYKDEIWIGRKRNWGQILGGHAICCHAVSDKRQAVRLINSWGLAYPPVWLGYKSVERLMSNFGEAVVSIDAATA